MNIEYEWSPRAQELFSAATALRDAGRLEEGRRACLDALGHLVPSQMRARGVVCREIGFSYTLEERNEEALPWFEQARDLRPAAGLTSLALFHCLLDLGRVADALREALRMSTLKVVDEYRTLFADSFITDVSPEYLELADRVRAQISAREVGSEGN